MRIIRMDWDAACWLNSPLPFKKEGDFWKKTLYGFEYEDRSALIA
ncbi:hypothetical protein [Paenibacillus endoradicis]|nr:hypothetical protein [Paenibacillus endoradicis]MCR8656869.1 hypothetical protein [Paenibacillus endoradicis]